MNALIIATGENAASDGAGERPPGFLLPLIDRPFLQHIVDFLTADGVVDNIDIVLSHMPEKVESLLKDGTRWGVNIKYHLVRDATQPYAALSRVDAGTPVLLLHADCLPQIFLKQSYASQRPAVFCSEAAWTGWALLDAAAIAGAQPQWRFPELSHFLLESARSRGTLLDCPIVLGVRSETEFFFSQRAALERRFHGLTFSGREVEDGTWIGRKVKLHPAATLVPPVYVGENSRINAGALIGPNSVVVRDCVLDCGATVVESVILPGSYVGQTVKLDHVIVDRDRVVNIGTGEDAVVRDDLVLRGIKRTSFRSAVTGCLSRIASLILFILTWPILLLTAIVLRLTRQGPVAYPIEALRLPAEDVREWKKFNLNSFASPESSTSALCHFFLRFLPGLSNVVRGQVDLIGVNPRSPEQVMALPTDWRVLYLRTRAGLLTEDFVLYGADASPDDVYSCEAYYSVAAGPRHDAKIFLRYVGRMFQPERSERRSAWSRSNPDSK